MTTPEYLSDSRIAVNTGYEIQINDLAMPVGNPVHKTGAIYKFAAPSNKQEVPPPSPSKPVGEWNTFEIEATNQKYSVILNGKKVISEFIGNRLTEGYILESKIMMQILTFHLKVLG
jgi:hypothetical protein